MDKCQDQSKNQETTPDLLLNSAEHKCLLLRLSTQSYFLFVMKRFMAYKHFKMSENFKAQNPLHTQLAQPSGDYSFPLTCGFRVVINNKYKASLSPMSPTLNLIIWTSFKVTVLVNHLLLQKQLGL